MQTFGFFLYIAKIIRLKWVREDGAVGTAQNTMGHVF